MSDENRFWKAVLERDAAMDGTFVVGVMTTGIYCRPSCPSRRPLRRNVRFFGTPEDAEQAGLRACLRCRPRERAGARIAELCRYIEKHADAPPDLADLAARAGLSRFHLQRSFKAAVGLTPREYAEACRVRKLKDALRTSGGVAAAVYDAGFGSSSRVYERADTRLGMTPAQYRKGGAGLAISWAASDSPAGLMGVGATDRGICFLQFGESADEVAEALRREYPAARIEPMPPPYTGEFRRWMDALAAHLEGRRPSLDLPVDIEATAFQMRVWKYLQSIPYGQVESYADVAKAIGRPKAARAVAQACASNRVAVLVPCHRVIRGSGDLGGYRWGLARKRTLIELEQRAGGGR